MLHSNKPPVINLLFALHCEARPFIEQLKLRRTSRSAFPHFTGLHDDPELGEIEINLLESGIGQINMATAIGWLGNYTVGRRVAWLNIGTAGHAHFDVGAVVRIVRCFSETSAQAIYPPRTAVWPPAADKQSRKSVQTGELLTGDKVCTNYPQQALVDMEGYAFLRSATRFSNSELIQIIKVVSDNSDSKVELLDADKLTALISAAYAQIQSMISALAALTSVIPQAAVISTSEAQQLRVSATQRLQLQDCIQNLLNLGVSENTISDKLALATRGVNGASGKTLLKELQQQCRETSPRLDSVS